MSGKVRTWRKQDAENRRDWFGTACIVSIVLHCLIIIGLPRPIAKDTELLVVRAMAFIRKDVVDPIRAPAVPEHARPNTDSRTTLDRVAQSEVLKVQAVPAEITPKEAAVPDEKLKFADKIERRPGGKSNSQPGFPDIIRNLISASCDKNMPNNVRMMGGRLEKIVVLTVTILPSGKLESVKVAQSSNLPTVDRASVEAVKLAAPFPRFPSNLGLSRLKLNVPIKFVISRKTG